MKVKFTDLQRNILVISTVYLSENNLLLFQCQRTNECKDNFKLKVETSTNCKVITNLISYEIGA